MSVVSVFFPLISARDIHLLPGLVSPRLDRLLAIEDTTGNTLADSPPAGVTVDFKLEFIGAPSDHGVTFNDATKEIEIASPLPPGLRLRSFIALLGCNEGSQIFSTQIRVYVHEAITEMWVTPSLLHVRKGAEKMRFSVLARFDDGVIGDITNWSRFQDLPSGAGTFVHRKGEAEPALHWSNAPGSQVTVDPDTGVLTCNAVNADEPIIVELRPLPAPPNRQAAGRVLGGPEWTTPVKLTHVQGKGFAGMADSRNILFLPDGFVDADRAQFCQLVRGIVKRLTYHPQASPFDLLSQQKSFNYFMAWVPSPNAGISVLNELDRINVVGTQAEGVTMETPVAPRPAAPAWSLAEMLWAVGPPTPVHDPPGSLLGTKDAGKLHDWRELYGEDIEDGLVILMYGDWLDLGDRVLLNEQDTAFHLAMSDRPDLTGTTSERTVDFNVMRLTQADFNRFLGALTDDKGNAVGGVWASGGADQDLVVVLCRSRRNGGSNAKRKPSGHLLALTIGDDPVHHLEESVAASGFDVVADPIPADVLTDTWLTVAHEFAHSWTLLDEYGGRGLIGNAEADKLVDCANIQPRKTLVNGAGLDGDKIKWRWPRIAKAGVLAAKPDDKSGAGTGPFHVQMRKNHGYQFGKGDVVRLRTRPLPTAVTSDRLLINRMLADGDLIELVLLPGSTLNKDNFPAGSILISPKRRLNPDGSPGDDMELVHPSVRARITATHNPLNAKDGDPPNRPCIGDKLDTPTGATNFAGGAAPNPPMYSSWIVGLHENGDEFDCDVYRPTGVCLLRQLTFSDRVTGRERGYEFCPVCRYAMVDVVDPFWHRDVDVGMKDRFLE